MRGEGGCKTQNSIICIVAPPTGAVEVIFSLCCHAGVVGHDSPGIQLRSEVMQQNEPRPSLMITFQMFILFLYAKYKKTLGRCTGLFYVTLVHYLKSVKTHKPQYTLNNPGLTQDNYIISPGR